MIEQMSKIDLFKGSATSNITVYQHDANSTMCIIQFMEDLEPYSLVDKTVVLQGIKADQNTIMYPVTVTDLEQGIIEFIVTDQMTVAVGVTSLQLIITGEDGYIKHSPVFPITVNSSLNIKEHIESENDYPIFIEAIEKIDKFNADFEIIDAKIAAGMQVVKDIDIKVPAANTAINDLTEKTAAGSNTVSNLDSKIAAGNTTVSTLENRTAAGNTTISTLEGKTTAGNTTVTNLTNKTNEGNTTVTTLTTKIVEGTTTTDTLQEKIEVATDLSNNLESNTSQLMADFTETKAGTDIKFDNSYSSDVNEIKIEGKTYQNVLDDSQYVFIQGTSEHIIKVQNTFSLNRVGGGGIDYFGYWTKLVKPNTTYTLILNLIENGIKTTNSDHWGLYLDGALNSVFGSESVVRKDTPLGVIRFKFTTRATDNYFYPRLNFAWHSDVGSDSTLKFKDVFLLEGDYTNKPIPAEYFEGIKSVGENEGNEIQVLSIGKNLDMGIEFPTSYFGYTDGVHSNISTVNSHKAMVRPNTSYISKNTSSNLTYWTSEGTFLGGQASAQYFVTPSNCAFVRYACDLGAKYVQLEEGTTLTSYTPFQEDKTQILLQEPLRSLPNGVADTIEKIGEEYKVVRRVGKVILTGNETFYHSGEHTESESHIVFHTALATKTNFGIYCDRFAETVSTVIPSYVGEGCYADPVYTVFYIKLAKNKLTTHNVDGFKNWLKDNPTTAYYELVTTIIEELTDTEQFELDHIRTFQEVTHITSTNSIKPTLTVSADKSIGGVVKDNVEKVDVIERELFNAETEVQGDSFKLKNTIDSVVTEIGVEGYTIQNLFTPYVPFEFIDNDPFFGVQKGTHTWLLKPNTVYSQIMLPWVDGVTQYVGYDGSNSIVHYTNKQCVSFSTGDTILKNDWTPHVRAGVPLKDISPNGFKFLLLEGDWTNKEIPAYVADIQGVGDSSKNLFDGELVQGAISDDNGTLLPGGLNSVSSANFAKVYPSTSYILSCNNPSWLDKVYYYDKNKAFIGCEWTGAGAFTTNPHCNYIKVRLFRVDGNIVPNDVTLLQIEQGEVSTHYEPYYKGYKVEVESVGKNLFDVQNSNTRCGAFDNLEGETIVQKEADIRPCFKAEGLEIGKQYTFKCDLMVGGSVTGAQLAYSLQYDGNYYNSNTLVSSEGAVATGNWHTGITCSFVAQHSTIYVVGSVGINRFSNIQIEEGSTPTDYKPFENHKAKLILSEQLHQLPNGVKDEIKLIGGKYKVVRRVGKVVLNGSEVYYDNGSDTGTHVTFYTHLSNMKFHASILCDIFKVWAFPVFTEECVFITESDILFINIAKSKLNNVITYEQFKKWLSENNTTVLYELAEPVIEEITSKEHLALKTLRTFDGLTHINCNSTVKPNMLIHIYDRSIKGLIDSNRHRIESLEQHLLEMKMMLKKLLSGATTLD